MSQDDKLLHSVDASGLTRREVFAGTAGLMIAGVSPVAAAAGPERDGRGLVGAQGAASGLEFIGQIAQVGPALTGYGYLTLVHGLPLEALYFPGASVRNEATARFTFYSTATVASVQSRESVIVAIANGQVEFFLRDLAGASFDDPLSFAQGQRIAADDAALQNVNNVIAPSSGLSNVFGDLRRTAVQPFQLDGTRYQLGHVGLRSRLVAPGRSTRIEPVAPTSVQVVAGNISNPQ